MGAHVTKAERQAYVKTFMNSGLSQTAFCKHININSRTFGHWVRTSLKNKTVSASQPPIYEEDIRVAEGSGQSVSLTVDSQPSFIPRRFKSEAHQDA